MIIWLNGAFGAGKTTCAFELNRRLLNSFVYDPEKVGYFIRNNVPHDLYLPDFQDYKQWREFNYEMLAKIYRDYNGIIIVPMTLINRSYYEEMIGRLIRDGADIKHYVLYADRRTVLKRLNRRLERGAAWAKSQLDHCIRAFDNDITEEKIITTSKTVDQVVDEIAARTGLTLLPDNRSRLKKVVDRIGILLKHI